MTLGEDINRLVSKGDGKQLKIAFLEMLASDAAIDLNVLGAFIEDIIMSNVDSTTIVTIKKSGRGLWSIHVSQEPVDSTTIVTIKKSGRGLWSIHVSQEPAKRDKLACGVGKGMILSLSIGTRNNILLLVTP